MREGACTCMSVIMQRKFFVCFLRGGGGGDTLTHTHTHKMNTDKEHTVAGIVNAIRQESLKCQGKRESR